MAENGQRVILVTRELLPSDTVHLDRRRLAGIVTQAGGIASHAAILARGLGIPAVTDVDVDGLPAYGGDWIVDGSAGMVVLNPTQDDLSNARTRSADYHSFRATLEAQSRGHAHTKDGVAIELLLNVENFEELPAELLEDLRGVGLFRTEFLFMAGSIFRRKKSSTSTTSRRSNAWAIARSPSARSTWAATSRSATSRRRPSLTRCSDGAACACHCSGRTVLRPAACAAAASVHGRMRIMFPMVTMVEEFRRARAIVDEIQSDLAKRGEGFDPACRWGR